MRRKRFEKSDAALLIAVAVFVFLLYWFSAYVDPPTLKAMVHSWGFYGPAVIVFMQVAFSVLAPLPNSIPVIVSGSLYGTYYGALYAGIGTAIGAAACYWLSIRFGRTFVKKMISRKHMETMDEFFARHGFESVAIARLIPVMSFDAVSYGAGLARMDFWKFMAATVIGMIPSLLLYSFIGDALSFQWLLVAMALIVILSAAALPFGTRFVDKLTGRKYPANASARRSRKKR